MCGLCQEAALSQSQMRSQKWLTFTRGRRLDSWLTKLQEKTQNVDNSITCLGCQAFCSIKMNQFIKKHEIQ